MQQARTPDIPRERRPCIIRDEKKSKVRSNGAFSTQAGQTSRIKQILSKLTVDRNEYIDLYNV